MAFIVVVYSIVARSFLLSYDCMKSQEKLIYLLAAAVALFVGQLVYHVKYADTVSEFTQVYESPREVKPFNLVDQNQQSFTKASLNGKWSF